jgi:hypothetical protein
VGRQGRLAEEELVVDLLDGEGDLVSGVAGEQVVGLEQAGEGSNGQAEDAEELEAFGEVVYACAELDDAADVEAEEGDFFGQAGEVAGFEGGDFGFAEAGGVEAVLEGVEVARLAAAAAVGGCGGGWIGHASFIANLFQECKGVHS